MEKIMKYEFYIYTKDGNDVWCWDINQNTKVIKDIEDNKADETFSVEVLCWLSETDCDYVEIYPKDESNHLPKYIKKEVNKVLEGINL